MYGVSKTIITKDREPDLWKYFHGHCILSKNLRNAAMFRLRQNFTSKGKEKLSDNETEVLDEIENTVKAYNAGIPGKMINYSFLEKLMRTNGNPDFFAGLPMQSAQAVLKGACDSFKSWLKSLKSYKADPSSFTGKPKMPGYIKKDIFKTVYTNQDAVIKGDGNVYLKLPLTKLTVRLDPKLKGVNLKEVQVIPYYGDFMLILIYEDDNAVNTTDMPNIAAIDTGLDNLVTLVSNSGSPGYIYKGGAVKTCNQWFNKKMSRLKAIQMKGHDPKTFHPEQTKRMEQLSRYRDCFINDYFHKMGCSIIKHLIKEKCGALIVGVNKMQKQSSDMGHKNNQNFVQIPYSSLRQILRYLCERNGIEYIEHEESYTSKASLLDMDYIPTYGQDDGKASFSGERIKRGLYRSKNGTVINADINAAGNILRKVYPKAFKNVDMDIFTKLTVIGFHDLYLKRNPAQRIAAA